MYDEKPDDPKHISMIITPVNTGVDYNAVIKNDGNMYTLTVGATTIQMPNTHSDPNPCFRLWPYFGRRYTAPCDMDIWLDGKLIRLYPA